MKILVVFTGGTIGSAVQNGYISPDQNKYKLIEKWKELHSNASESITFSYQEPLTTLSENMTCDKLEILLKAVEDAIKEQQYDGIIVCHGTDTLQYSAAAIGYLTGLDSIPVVVVSSNYVIEDSRANGLQNFSAAVDFISSQSGRGTFIAYQNTGDEMKIHRASRVLPHLPVSDDVVSVMNQIYGVMHFESDQYLFEKNADYVETKDEMAPFDAPFENEEQSHILQVYPYTGMSYPELTNSTKAVLHHSYHSGTICSQSEALAGFALKAKEKRVPIFLAGANYNTDYESTKIFNQLGIIVLGQSSPIAMYMKLWMGICQGQDPCEFMNRSLAGDIMPR